MEVFLLLEVVAVEVVVVVIVEVVVVVVEVVVPVEVVVTVEVVVVAEVLVLVVVQIRPDEPSNILSLSAVEVSHASPQSVCANDDAPENISSMLATLDTSHLEIPPLNDDA